MTPSPSDEAGRRWLLSCHQRPRSRHPKQNLRWPCRQGLCRPVRHLLPLLARCRVICLDKWSTSETSCEDDQASGVTVFSITPREIGWHERSNGFNQRRRGSASKVGKGRGAKGTGYIDFRRVDPSALDVYGSPMSFAAEARYWLRRCLRPAPPSAQPTAAMTPTRCDAASRLPSAKTSDGASNPERARPSISKIA